MLRGRCGHRESGVRHVVRFPPFQLDDALRFHAPRFEVGADAERGHEWDVAPSELADRRVVEVIVVIVRHDHDVDRRHRTEGNGWKRLGPTRRDGDARGPQTGSVSTRRPSISISTVEWPSQVARSPLSAGFAQTSSGFTDGSAARGTRRSPPHRNSPSVGIDTVGSRRPAMIGCTLRKCSPVQSGDALMRSRRSPSAFLPSDLMANDMRAMRPMQAASGAFRIGPRYRKYRFGPLWDRYWTAWTLTGRSKPLSATSPRSRNVRPFPMQSSATALDTRL